MREPELRQALTDYLGRVRGVVSDPGRVLVTSGYAQGRMLVCRALAATGAKRVAVEEPCHVGDLHATILHLMGLEHHRLTYFHQGLDQRLTGVLDRRVISKVLA